ncbi:MAG: SURF1 family protein [Burkholderiaceae bacterium]|nr:SURF1 family protein [Burkholderiaceae bacterium]
MRFWIVTLAAMAGIAGTVSLGRWQLDRAAQKMALHDAIEAQRNAPAVGGGVLAGHPDLSPWLHRRVTLQGEWAADRTVYLDNRQMHGRPGFYVLTPLRLAQGGVVLVQRGWVPRDFQDRTRLMPVQTPSGTVTIDGRVAPPPGRLYALGNMSEGPGAQGASRIRQNLDLNAFRTETGLPLAEGSIVQTGAASEGLQREWPEVATGVEKHYGYAAQWFGFGGLMAILYVWFQFIVPRRRRRAPAAD